MGKKDKRNFCGRETIKSFGDLQEIEDIWNNKHIVKIIYGDKE